MYLDANVFVQAILNTKETGKRARKLLSNIENNKMTAYSSVLAFDEALWAITKNKPDQRAKIWKILLSIPNLRILDINKPVAIRVNEFLEKGIKPRDSIHLALMFEYGIDIIISEDKHFDNIKGIIRRSI